MVIVQPEAEADLREARAWYERQPSGQGEEFLAEIDRVFAMIEARPDGYAVVHRTARKASARRFPYFIIYVARDNDVFVLGVVHHRRNPKLVMDRIT